MQTILTPSGYKNIADCAVGDEVSAFDLTTGAPIVNTIETITWVDAKLFQDWQNPLFMVNGQPRVARSQVYELQPPRNEPQPTDVRDLSIGNQVYRFVEGEYIFDFDVETLEQVDPDLPFKFFKINGTWTLNSEQSIWRNGTSVCHARDLVVGDVIYDDADRAVTIAALEEVSVDGWYRFDISGDHSYIIDGLTLHNASRFWVLGTGPWDGTTPNWSAATGSTGGASTPGSADIATFDAASGGGTVTVNTTVLVQAIVTGAFTGTLDFSVNNNNSTCSGSSGFSITGTVLRGVKLGGGTHTLSSASQAAALWNAAVVTNLTFDAGTSTILYSSGAASGRSFAGGGLPYNNLTINGNASKGILSFTASNTFVNLTVNGPNALVLPVGTIQTITGALSILGSSGNLIGLGVNVPGTSATISKASGSVAMAYCGISDITCSGGASFTASPAYDLGRNAGITITEPTGGSTGSHMIGG